MFFLLKLKCKSFVISFFLLILIQANAHAFQVIDNQTVDINKAWTIKFTDNVGLDELTQSSITVMDSKGNVKDVLISQGNDSKSLLVKAPKGGYTPGESYTLAVNTKAHSSKGKSLKQVRSIHFNVKGSNEDDFDRTKIESNSIKLYYDDEDIIMDVRFSRAIDQVNCDDFTVAGVKPDVATTYGSKVSFRFKDSEFGSSGNVINYENNKSNINPSKVDIIKAAGVSAQIRIVGNPTTCDETGSAISSSLTDQQSRIYDYQLAPKTTSDYWSATKDGKVYITFDTPIGVNGGARLGDFIFSSANGTNLEADSLQVLGKTVVFIFDTSRYKDCFTNNNQIAIRAKNTAVVRGEKDRDGNSPVYVPSKDDLRNRTVNITE